VLQERMLSRRRRLLLHALLALGMGALSWLFLVSGFTGLIRLLSFGAAGASIMVGTGFAVRFLSVLSSEPDRAIPASLSRVVAEPFTGRSAD